ILFPSILVPAPSYLPSSSFRIPTHTVILLICFFFQAEDGIRVRNVTGVQTCALPISWRGDARASPGAHAARDRLGRGAGGSLLRSEERRVGKECRCWGATYL